MLFAAVSAIPLMVPGVSTRPFQGSERTSFATSDHFKSHKPKTDVSNVESLGTGGVSTTIHQRSRQKQLQQRRVKMISTLLICMRDKILSAYLIIFKITDYICNKT